MGQSYLREHILDCANQQLYDMANVQRYEHQLYRCRYVQWGVYTTGTRNVTITLPIATSVTYVDSGDAHRK